MAEHKWLGEHSILDPSHANDLEVDAAINEFQNKMPRKDAELAAHAAYRKKHHIAAAGHHYAGMKAALSGGDQEQSKKHSMMYELHMKEAGLDPHGPVPGEVLTAAASPETKLYRFKPHLADSFLLQKKDEILDDLMKDEDGWVDCEGCDECLEEDLSKSHDPDEAQRHRQRFRHRIHTKAIAQHKHRAQVHKPKQHYHRQQDYHSPQHYYRTQDVRKIEEPATFADLSVEEQLHVLYEAAKNILAQSAQ